MVPAVYGAVGAPPDTARCSGIANWERTGLTTPDPARDLLRHTLATVAYRGGKALRDVPADFGTTRPGPGSRSALEILAHIGDLFDWACHLAGGEHIWNEAGPGEWDIEVERFYDGLARLDAILASQEPLGFPAQRLFQGPIADALTHIGQIAQLRRLAGSPVRGENYFKADIVSGRTGRDQTPPRREFE